MKEVFLFSNSSEYASWAENNCAKCRKFDCEIGTLQYSSCEIESAIMDNAAGCPISSEILKRLGYVNSLPTICGEFEEAAGNWRRY